MDPIRPLAIHGMETRKWNWDDYVPSGIVSVKYDIPQTHPTLEATHYMPHKTLNDDSGIAFLQWTRYTLRYHHIMAVSDSASVDL